MSALPTVLTGAAGRCYHFEELLQQRPHLGRVWTARANGEKFVLKDIPINIFSHFNERIWPRIGQKPSALLRLPLDTIPEKRIFVYPYLRSDFLQLAKAQIPLQARRHILKDTLQAIVDLHDQDIVHLDIKPDNIVVDHTNVEEGIEIQRVNLIDLENVAHLPGGRCIKGMLAGNENWRSPEAHFKGELNKPADMFSFGLVCIYAVLQQIICGPDEDMATHESQGALPTMIRMQRLVSYFGEKDGLNGLIKHIGDDQISCELLSVLWDERAEDYIPYEPFEQWPAAGDESFKDLVKSLMNLDPAKRLTAPAALEHAWFADDS